MSDQEPLGSDEMWDALEAYSAETHSTETSSFDAADVPLMGYPFDTPYLPHPSRYGLMRKYYEAFKETGVAPEGTDTANWDVSFSLHSVEGVVGWVEFVDGPFLDYLKDLIEEEAHDIQLLSKALPGVWWWWGGMWPNDESPPGPIPLEMLGEHLLVGLLLHPVMAPQRRAAAVLYWFDWNDQVDPGSYSPQTTFTPSFPYTPWEEALRDQEPVLREAIRAMIKHIKTKGGVNILGGTVLSPAADSFMATDPGNRESAIISKLGDQGKLFELGERHTAELGKFQVGLDLTITPPEGVTYTYAHARTTFVVAALVAAAEQESKRPGRTNHVGPWVLSVTDIARHLYHPASRTPTKRQRERTKAMLADLIGTVVRLKGTDFEGESFGLEGAPWGKQTATAITGELGEAPLPNGEMTEALEVLKFPILLRTAQRFNMWKNIQALVEPRKGWTRPRTDEAWSIYYLLANYLLLWHGSRFKGPDHGYRLRYDTLAEQVGGPYSTNQITDKRWRNLKKYAGEALNEFQSRGYVTKWSLLREGRAGKETTLVIHLPKNLPPLEAIDPMEPWRDPPALTQ